jgi:hypothetical protein
MLRKQFIWPAFGAFAALVTLCNATALAERRIAPDGGSAAQTRRAPEPDTFTCGSIEFSKIVTQRSESTTTSTTFAPLSNATVTIDVKSKLPRCVKVVLTAETACSPTPSGDYCYVRALQNSRVMSPGNNFQAIDSEHGTAQGHSFAWISRVQSGQHTFSIEWRVRDKPTVFFIDDWTLEVQVLDGHFGDGY